VSETTVPALSDDLIDEVCGQVRAHGSYPEVVAASRGMTVRRFNSLLKRGRELDAEGLEPADEAQAACLRLAREVAMAEATVEMAWLREAVRQANEGKRGHGPLIELLGRRFPDRWRKREMLPGRGLGSKSIEQALQEVVKAQQESGGGG